VRDTLAGLQVDAVRMAANLAATHGQVMAEALAMALAPHAGRDEAQRLVRRASERARAAGAELRSAAAEDEAIRSALPAEALDRVFDPARYLGSADALIDRALADFRALQSEVGTHA
jgi:3-carboxy-cis,cis-muconate cycloisomerase